MQASVRTADRAVVQVGVSIGPRPGCLIQELGAQEETDLRAAFDQPHGIVYLAANGAVTFDSPSPAPPPDPQIATDKALVVAFMNSTVGQPTQLQIENTLRAVVRYLRRRGDDA